MKNSIGLAVMAAVLALAACGGGEEQGTGGVTAEESKQLNEAAEMLDASPDSLVISNEAELGNGDAGADLGDGSLANDSTNETE